MTDEKDFIIVGTKNKVIPTEIIVRTGQRLFILDHDLNIQATSNWEPNLKSMYLLPNKQIMTLSNDSLQILDAQNLQLIFKTNKIRNSTNAFLNLRLYINNDDIVSVYE